MFKPRALNSLSFLVLVLAIGCNSSPESKLEGKWKYESVDQSSATNPLGSAVAAQLKSQNPTIEFKSDKHFVEVGFPMAEGDWAIRDNTVTLNKTSVGGKDISSQKKQMDEELEKLKAQSPQLAESMAKLDLYGPQTGTLSEDGKTLKIKDNFMGVLTYTKLE